MTLAKVGEMVDVVKTVFEKSGLKASHKNEYQINFDTFFNAAG